MSAYESTGKTVEEAVSEGLKQLNLGIGDVQVDILEEGSKGLFGLFGSKMARVRLTVKDDDDAAGHNVFAGSLDSYTASRKTEQRIQAREQEMRSAVPQPQPKPVAPKPPAASAPHAPKAPASPKASVNPPAAPKARPVKAEATPAPSKPAAARAPKAREERPARPRAPVATKDANPNPPQPAQQRDSATQEGQVQTFLQQLTRLMSVEVSVHVHTDPEGNIRVSMEGDPLGILIGRRGETLDSLQYLTSLHLNRGQDTYTRVTLDSEGYRAKREDALIRLANRMAIRAEKTGRKVSMEPMNPYERRILHSALQNHAGITTHSEGEEPNRHVVITLVKEVETPSTADDAIQE